MDDRGIIFCDFGIKGKQCMSLFYTTLPIIELYYKELGWIDHKGGRIIVKTGSGNIESLCTQRYRGNTSKAANYEKKSYAIKLFDENGKRKIPLLGMRESDEWILDPMPCDYSRMRNIVSFKLWKDMDSKYPGIDGKFVEVFVNHEYMGIYCLTEKVDRQLLGLKKTKGGNIRGILYKCRNNLYPSSFFTYDITDDSLKGWWLKYPKNISTSLDIWTPLKRVMKFLSSDIIDDYKIMADSLIDISMVIDNYLLLELMSAYDNIGCNKYVYWNDYEKDKKMKMIPWDMDRTWTRLCQEEKALYEDRMFQNSLYTRLLQDYPCFHDLLSERWRVLRGGIFSEDKLVDRFDSCLMVLEKSGAAKREEMIWSKVHEVEYQPKRGIKDWILFRKPQKQSKKTLKEGENFLIKEEVEKIKEYIPIRLHELDIKYGCK
ncbi:MAG: CotH kinase family protein [Prevotellaceae bacterium]|nr:CotH kinase family protein [Prevotellaceae bacterium]